MAFTKGTESKPIARVFVLTDTNTIPTKFGSGAMDAIITSGTIPTSASTGASVSGYKWVQIYTGDGGVEYVKGRSTSDITNQQIGVVDVVVDEETSTLRMTVAANSLAVLRDLNVFNVGSTGSSGHMGDKEARGASMFTKGLSFLVYDKNTDANNETDNPNVSADAFTWVVFNAVPLTEAGMKWNAERNTVSLEYRLLASTSTGSSKGYKSAFGSFTSAV